MNLNHHPRGPDRRAIPPQAKFGDAALVARWHSQVVDHLAQAAERVAAADARAARDPHPDNLHLAERYRRQVTEARALAELLARGVDPSRPRLFRGRVQTELICRPRGHVLARVYPTAEAPVLVPNVGASPGTPSDTVEGRFGPHGSAGERIRRSWFQAGPAPARDEWIKYDAGEVSLPGTVVLSGAASGNGSAANESEDVSVALRCRCGTRWIQLATVIQAVADGQRRHVL